MGVNRDNLDIIVTKCSPAMSENSIGYVSLSSSEISKIPASDIWIELSVDPYLKVNNIYYRGKIIKRKCANIIFHKTEDFIDLPFSSEILKNNDQIVKLFRKAYQKPNSTNICLKLFFVKYIKLIFYPLLRVLSFSFCHYSLCAQNLKLRLQQIQETCILLSSGKQCLLAIRLLGMICTDVIIGVILVILLISSGISERLGIYLEASAWMLADNVQDLFSELRGAPAGLKLNQPLTEAYAGFCSYIVSLWMIYLDRASWLVATLVGAMKYVGVFGVTFQAALCIDIVNLVVLYLYCVYVYTARIHTVQISLLGSQWRAFCGLKWNPLKKRVDTIYDFHQRPVRKVITAFIFTLVVFLLPTTSIYYAVFVVIWLGIAGITALIKVIIWGVNYNPISLLLLRLMKSSKIKGQMYMRMTETSDKNHPHVLEMEMLPLPLSTLISVTDSKDLIPVFPQFSLRKLCSKVIYATDLI